MDGRCDPSWPCPRGAAKGLELELVVVMAATDVPLMLSWTCCVFADVGADEGGKQSRSVFALLKAARTDRGIASMGKLRRVSRSNALCLHSISLPSLLATTLSLDRHETDPSPPKRHGRRRASIIAGNPSNARRLVPAIAPLLWLIRRARAAPRCACPIRAIRLALLLLRCVCGTRAAPGILLRRLRRVPC